MGNSDNYWMRRVNASHLSRRRFVGGAATAGVGAAALGLVGCGDDDAAPAATTAPSGTTAPVPTTAAGTSPTAVAPAAVADGGIYRAIWLGGSQFDSADVHRNFRDETSWLSNYVLAKIIRFKNPDTGELEGDIAEKWETPDSQSYTFNIRKDIKWQNTRIFLGDPLGGQTVGIEPKADALCSVHFFNFTIGMIDERTNQFL